MFDRAAVLALLAIAVPQPQPAAAADPSAADPVAAFLFSYEVKPGLSAQFEEGYSRHLEWHRSAHDPFAWYGWYVTAGPRIGRFVDGTFGITYEAFDRRVDPAGDRADAVRNLSPYVEPVERSVWRHRPDLDSGVYLESRERIRMLEARRYVVRPGAEAAFEASVRTAAAESEDEAASSWYELVVGGEAPTYLRLTPRAGFAGFQVPAARVAIGDAVTRVETEVWSMVDKLSYFPEPGAE